MSAPARTGIPAPRPAGALDPHGAGVQVQPIGRWAAIARVRGEIDLHTTSAVRGRIIAALARPNLLALVVDLSEVDFLGASGLAMLVDLRARCALRAVDLRLVAGRRVVLRPLAVCGLTDDFALYPDDTAALARYRAMP
ncbi:STAS domain-containing protein [Actinokineospora sp.]|uniref:STAS domain-containing protein n=1 Tax=Actinokineospora sp. TaxID=1872133 RepID=UPI0040382F09